MSPSSSSTGWCAVRGAIRRATIFPKRVRFHADGDSAEILPLVRARQSGASCSRSWRRWSLWFLHQPDAEGLRGARARVEPEGRALRRLLTQAHGVLRLPGFRAALAGLAGISEVSGAIGQLRPVISPGYGFTAIIVAFLGRLNPLGIVAAGLVLGADLSRRRGGADLARRLRQGGARLPGHAAVLRARLRHAHPLPHPHFVAWRAPQAGTRELHRWESLKASC